MVSFQEYLRRIERLEKLLGMALNGGSTSSAAFIFDGGTPRNGRTDRPADQSPIDNTKVGIINLGSSTAGVGIGVLANYGIILGGDDCSVDANATYSTNLGGYRNYLGGNYSVVGGSLTEVDGDYSAGFGFQGFIGLGCNYNFAAGNNPFIDLNGLTPTLNSAVFGDSCQIVGANGAFAAGTQTQVTANYGTAFGSGGVCSGIGAFVFGINGAASGATSFVGGNGCSASGESAVAIGTDCHANGSGSVCFGANSTVALGCANSIIVGNGCSVGSSNAQAFGFDCHVSVNNVAAMARGWGATTHRETEEVYASDNNSSTGNAETVQAQKGRVILTGTTSGLAQNESVELLYGPNAAQFTLTPDKAYIFEINAVAAGIQDGSPLTKSFSCHVNARKPGAGALQLAVGTIEKLSPDGGTALWNMTVTAGVGPDRLNITFVTGAGNSAAVSVACELRYTEVYMHGSTP